MSTSTISKPAALISIDGYRMGNPLLAVAISASLAVGFYAIVLTLMAVEIAAPITGPLSRYFLGHPVAVAATVLFCCAIGILASKQYAVMQETNLLRRIFDEHLAPKSGPGESPAKAWLAENDAGHVARAWLDHVAALPGATLRSQLVRRLSEVLVRQSQRGSSKQLPDDLRELSSRDADAAHDSLGMVRIIVWAIPMLGFLGTVIGITQTLGGLDFSNGAAAVDNLKSGLYVAFDTTAVGLVLSVVAIFLQFPVERGEQNMLSTIDARIGALVLSHLPNDDASDNQTVLIADLCRGVQAAVAESLENQATLWRDTIDEARGQWQGVHDDNNNKLVQAFQVSLVPALVSHTETLAEHSEVIRQSQERFESLAKVEESLGVNLRALTETGQAIDRSLENQRRIENESDETMADAVRTLARAVDVLSRHMAAGGAGTSQKVIPDTDRADSFGRAA